MPIADVFQVPVFLDTLNTAIRLRRSLFAVLRKKHDTHVPPSLLFSHYPKIWFAVREPADLSGNDLDYVTGEDVEGRVLDISEMDPDVVKVSEAGSRRRSH